MMRTLRRRQLSRYIIVAILSMMIAWSPCLAIEFTIRANAAQVTLSYLAYQNSAYWSSEFAAEFKQWETFLHYDERGFSYHKDFTGTWATFRDGQRHVPGQPTQYTATVWLFGDSAAVGYGVPDDMTIAAYLQKLLPSYRVVNVATMGSNASQNRYRLETTPIQRGDIVIFYGGILEVSGVYHALRHDSGLCATVLDSLYFIRTARMLCTPGLSDAGQLQDTVKEYTDRYKTAIATARAYTADHGATFLNVLQPHLRSMPLSAYDLQVAEATEYQAFELVLFTTWTALQTTPGTLDLTHALDDMRASGHVVNLDFVHVNEQGNQEVAARIAVTVRRYP